MTVVHARTPAKIMLIGEHAALHGCPALAVSVGLYCNVWGWPRADEQIEVHLPDLSLHQHYSPAALIDYTRKVRQAWQCFQKSPSVQAFTQVNDGDRSHLVKCALGECLLRLDPQARCGFSVRVESAIPVGAGFGSSGALAVALTATLQRLFKRSTDLQTLDRLAMTLERYVHGQPSGIDHNVSLYGSIIERRSGVNDTFEFASWPATALSLPQDLKLYHTGTARESTGHVIAATRHRLEGADNPLLASMRRNAERFCKLMQQQSPIPQTLKAVLRDYELDLETLGVVPRPIAKVVRAIELAGGAAKICGAGALSGDQAGAMLVVDAPQLPELARYRRIDAPLAVGGLELSEQ